MVGIDMVCLSEFQRQLDVGGVHLRERMFVPAELANPTLEHLAGVWAAKEAVMKAAPEAPHRMTDIVIAYRDSGKPFAVFAGRVYDVSIAHHGDYAVAVAMVEEQ